MSRRGYVMVDALIAAAVFGLAASGLWLAMDTAHRASSRAMQERSFTLRFAALRASMEGQPLERWRSGGGSESEVCGLEPGADGGLVPSAWRCRVAVLPPPQAGMVAIDLVVVAPDGTERHLQAVRSDWR